MLHKPRSAWFSGDENDIEGRAHVRRKARLKEYVFFGQLTWRQTRRRFGISDSEGVIFSNKLYPLHHMLLERNMPDIVMACVAYVLEKASWKAARGVPGEP